MSAASLSAPAATAPPAPTAETAPSPEARRGMRLSIPFVSSRIAGKIIAPYLVIIFVLALLTVYIVSRLLISSLNERFDNLLRDNGHAANEAMVKMEDEFLQTLRLMTNTEGVAEALRAQNLTKLEELLLPLRVNSKTDLVDVIAADGTTLMALRSTELGGQSSTHVDDQIGQSSLAQSVLAGQNDNLGDKFTGLVQAKWGYAIYAAAPVKVEDTLVGTIMIGTTLERALERLTKEAQAMLIVYGPDGKLVATTIPVEDLEGVSVEATDTGSSTSIDIEPQLAQQAVGDEPVLVRRTLDLKKRTYQELVGSLEIRTRPAAPMGVAMPVTFIQQAAFASRTQIIAVMGAVVLGVLLMGLSLARAITRPIAMLVRATEMVATGNLDTEVQITTSDETGKLTASFNQMVAGLREREKIRNMFSQFVTGAVAEAVLQGKVKLGGARADISILISDVRSFTTLSEGMEPEQLVSMLNRYFNLMIDAIIEYDGVLDKFLGDGIITEYNCPLEQERHELRAVLTALRMREYLKQFNADQEVRGEQTIRIGIGVHSGPAVVGNVGAEGKKLEYTAMGDTVNCASRLEGQTKEVNSDIVISSVTYDACKDFIDVGEPMALHVKGRLEPIIAHKLIRLKPGLTLGPELIFTALEEVRAITEANDDGGAGLEAAERENALNPALLDQAKGGAVPAAAH